MWTGAEIGLHAGSRILWLAENDSGVPGDLAWLSGPERAEAEAMRIAVRRRAFLLRRWTARRLLAPLLGLDGGTRVLSRIEIRRSAAGAPHVFLDGAAAPLSLSITDREDVAVAAVAPAGVCIGCDLETIEPRSPAFVEDFLGEDEARFVAAGGDVETRHLRANLVWSAKESVLKALGVGLRRDTRSVTTRFADAGGAGAGEDWRPFTAHAPGTGEFEGWWRRSRSFVVAVAADRPTARPRAVGWAPVALMLEFALAR
jgi:4'-phosphopantetheinyl transferase